MSTYHIVRIVLEVMAGLAAGILVLGWIAFKLLDLLMTALWGNK